MQTIVANKPDMKEYYDMRHKVRELYATGVQVNPRVNDLCSEILQLRDKDRTIESINIDTINFIIEVELEDGVDYNKNLQVQNSISNIIDSYIDNNIPSINGVTRQVIEEVKHQKLYDQMGVGNYIKFSL